MDTAEHADTRTVTPLALSGTYTAYRGLFFGYRRRLDTLLLAASPYSPVLFAVWRHVGVSPEQAALPSSNNDSPWEETPLMSVYGNNL